MRGFILFLIVGIFALVKIVITGAGLAIGFKAGYVVWDKTEAHIRKQKINVSVNDPALAVL